MGAFRSRSEALIAAVPALLAVAPILFVAWAIQRSGDTVEPADAVIALGALLLAEGAAALTVVRLFMRPRALEATILALAMAVAVLEILFFFWAAVAFALRMPMTPA